MSVLKLIVTFALAGVLAPSMPHFSVRTEASEQSKFVPVRDRDATAAATAP